MKYLLSPFLVYFLCSFAQAQDSILVDLDDFSIVGNWKVDTSWFIMDDVKGEPVIPKSTLIWTFSSDGTCKVLRKKGSYTQKGKTVSTDIAGISNNSEIHDYSANSMTLYTLKMENDEMKLEIELKLSRIDSTQD